MKPKEEQLANLYPTHGPVSHGGLVGRLRVAGGRIRKTAGRVAVTTTVLAVGLGVLSVTSTLAGAPETPLATTPSEVTASTALLHGLLEPLQEGEPGSFPSTYEFLYKESKTTCLGGSKTPEGLALGAGMEEVSQELTGLKANTQYTMCLLARNEGKTATSAPLTFTTAPEAPDTLSPAKLITATTATLEGVLNPKATAKAGWYFAYKPEVEAPCTGASTTPLQAEAEVKAKKVEAKVTELQPSKKYLFCLVATNASGAQFTQGNEVAFETLALPPEVIAASESAAPVAATEATLNAQINPNNQETKYAFEYSLEATGETLEGTVETVDGEAPIPPEQFGPTSVGVSTGAVLHADRIYYYRVLAENAKGEKDKGKVEHFMTAPEAPEQEEAAPIGTTTATLKGVLAPNATLPGEPGTYEFLYRQSASECTGGSTVPHPAGNADGAEAQAVSFALTGLAPDTQYTFCLLERNAVGEAAVGSPVTFTTRGAGISAEQVGGVEATVATLQATIDPNESATSYHFEYDTSPYTSNAPHGVSVPSPSAEIGSGTTPVLVSVPLADLQPDRTYHYRVVVVDEIETFYGPDKTLTTSELASSSPETCPNAQRRAEQPFGLALPDCRAYEMVSPSETSGQDATDAKIFPGSRASVLGNAFTYASRGSFASPTGATVENQLLSLRGPDGWTTQAITPLHEPDQTEPNNSYEATAFTPELTAGIASTDASLTPEAPVTHAEGGSRPQDLYLTDFATGSYQYVAEVADPMGVSTDLSDVVFGELGSVSEWASGRIVAVGVTNEGESMDASVGAAAETPSPGFDRQKDTWHAVSTDGARVYFTSPGFEEENSTSLGVHQLYVRVNAEQSQSPMNGEECAVAADACTIEVSASQRATLDPHGPQSARYWGASADGSKVFFTSKAELTEDAYTGTEDNAANLYEYDLEDGTLTDLTVDAADAAEGAAVQGVVQISEDGSYVYFVADGDLAEGATAGAPNLYVYHNGGAPTFIATLAANDHSDWHYGSFPEAWAGPAVNTAAVSPSGEHLAFVSERSLTGYDNAQSRPGQCEGEIVETGGAGSGNCREVYLYDAATRGLVCASCNPTGARPVGPSGLRQLGVYAFTQHRARNVLDDGTLFFNSSDALVSHASDGRENVYEYEGGHVYAISDAEGAHASFFLDASASGDDVFFATANDLLPQVTGANVVVYDARVEGGFPTPTAPPTCSSGESCKPPPTPQPMFGAPATATFSGPGNLAPSGSTSATGKKTAAQLRAEKLAKALKACHKKKAKKKREACEKSARSRYGPAKTKKAKKGKQASDVRRASR